MPATPLVNQRAVIPIVIDQHVNEAATLWTTRRTLVSAPVIDLSALARHDSRLFAHLDGLAVASADAWPFCEAGLEEPTPGAVFTAAIRAIDDRNRERLDRIVALAETAPWLAAGLVSAFGWLERRQLQGTVARLLGSPHGFRRMTGIAACAVHRVDPGLHAAQPLDDPDLVVRARLLRAAGELGHDESLRSCTAAVRDDEASCRLWGAWSAVLLGNRGVALDALTCMAREPGPHRLRAFRLALQAMAIGASHKLLQELAAHPQQQRWVIQGSGVAGNPAYAPWLARQMSDDATARLAGEAFTLITGVDISNGLDRPQPENVETGPTENAHDQSVAMDPDDGLPWPDREKVEQWWARNAGRFKKGERYFLGAPVTRAHCIDVLNNGCQRQRVLAAHYLCLLDPGTPLFNTSAPAWRQQKLLADMS